MEAGKTGNKACDNNFDSDTLDEFVEKLRYKRNKALTTVGKFTPAKHKIYFAGPWFDERSNMLYNFCVDVYKTYKPFIGYDIFFPREQINEKPLDAFINNVNNIKDCDAMVALVSKKDVGTAWEIGMAYSLGKRIFLLGYDETTFKSHTNVMLAFTGKCLTIDNFGKFLTSTMCDSDYIQIQNEWEGIE